MSDPANHVHLTADLPAPREQVFRYFTDDFHELWPGRMEHLEKGKRSEPLGKGFRRRMHTPAGKLEEEIVTHKSPSLIEYKVTNGDEAPFYNHLGRIELTERDGGTHVDYTVSYDYKPALLGPVSAGILKTMWKLRGSRKLAKAFPG